MDSNYWQANTVCCKTIPVFSVKISHNLSPVKVENGVLLSIEQDILGRQTVSFKYLLNTITITQPENQGVA